MSAAPLLLLALAGATPADLVDPMTGTRADFGQLAPAATAPFGMVQLGPDTDPANHAGYDDLARRLIGFSHTRGVGVGCGGAGGDLLVSLAYAGSPSPAAIDKPSERAAAGRYHLRYGGGIVADMVATRGAGLLRFILPRDGVVRLTMDAAHAYAKRHEAHWLTRDTEDLRAEMVAGTVCDVGRYRLFSATRVRLNGRPLAARTAPGDGATLRIALRVRAGDRIELRTGLSGVDADGAARVRAAELGERGLDRVAADTRAAWNRVLGVVRPQGRATDRALFYTALFRAFQTPVAIDDPDRRHRGSDGRIGVSAPGETRYTSWSLWDNYRTQMPLLALLQPARAADVARSLTALYDTGKPRWGTGSEPFLTVRTEHAGVALLDMRRKGITGFDAAAALRGMASDSERLQRDTPDQQIEAAYDDWAVAGLAADLGRRDTAADFLTRAHRYRAMWRDVFETPGADGDTVKARGLYQGTIWQYRWAPVFDWDWIVATVGRENLVAQLDDFFGRGLFNMTNEPDIHVPWLYAALGHPQPTTDLVRTILTAPIAHPYTNSGKRCPPFVGPSFALSPQGFADGMDDDAGGMTGWYAFATLGLYPLVPGEPWYLVSVPGFARTVLTLARGHRLELVREGPRDGAIVSATLDGRPLPDFRVAHAALLHARRLVVRTASDHPAPSRGALLMTACGTEAYP